MKRLCLLILFFCVALSSFPNDAGNKHRSFNSEKTTEFLQDNYYLYDDNPMIESQPWLKRMMERLFRGVTENIHIGMPNEILLYLVGLIILFIIIRKSRFSWSQLFSKSDRHVATVGEIRPDESEMDFLALANELEGTCNYGLAAHFRFLNMMKTLNLAGIISIEENKTNWEYVRTINDDSLRIGFMYIVSEYDRIWYGEYLLSEHGYNEMKKQFGEIDRMLT